MSKQKDGNLFYSQGLKFEEVVIYFESVVMEFKRKKNKRKSSKAHILQFDKRIPTQSDLYLNRKTLFSGGI